LEQGIFYSHQRGRIGDTEATQRSAECASDGRLGELQLERDPFPRAARQRQLEHDAVSLRQGPERNGVLWLLVCNDVPSPAHREYIQDAPASGEQPLPQRLFAVWFTLLRDSVLRDRSMPQYLLYCWNEKRMNILHET